MSRTHHKIITFSQLCVLAATLALMTCSGCGPGEPQLTAAKGRLTKGGAPINKAEVRFIPTDESLVGNWTASGVTDADGNFVLRLPTKQESECVIGECKVTVNEAPMPEEARSNLESSGDGSAYDKHMRSLKNRPIPENLRRMGTTTFTFEVTADREVYDLVIP